jgi:hypothetical protein
VPMTIRGGGDPRQGAPGKLAKDRRCKSSTG